MIRWIKNILWRRKLENKSAVVIEERTMTHGYSSKEYNLDELRQVLAKGDIEHIRTVLSNELKKAGLRDSDIQDIMEDLDEHKVKVVIRKIGLLDELEKRERQRNQCAASSPISR